MAENSNNNNNINNNNNHSSQPQVTGLNFLRNEWQEQLTSSLTAFHDNVASYQKLKLKLGAFAEIINYIIQENKQFNERYIEINNKEIKFNFVSIMSELFIDNRIENGFITASNRKILYE